MQPWVPMLPTVPDCWKSKCGGRFRMPTRSTPPRFGFGSGAASWNLEPSNSFGMSARVWAGRSPYAAAIAAALPWRKPRRPQRRVSSFIGSLPLCFVGRLCPVEPERVLPAHVIGAEIVVRPQALDVVVPDVVDLLPRHRQQ